MLIEEKQENSDMQNKTSPVTLSPRLPLFTFGCISFQIYFYVHNQCSFYKNCIILYNASCFENFFSLNNCGEFFMSINTAL